MFTARVLTGLLASPSGLAAERAMVEKAIHEWNTEHSRDLQIVLLPSKWETDVTPAYGEAPQAVINRSIVDPCDLLIGFFGETLGTKTTDAASGTVSEILRVHKAEKPVLVYFGKRRALVDDLDLDQVKALRDFKKSCQDKSFYREFTDADDLARQVSKDLLRLMRSMRFPDPERVDIPSNYLLEGDRLTLRTQTEDIEYFTNQPDRESVIFENALVLFCTRKISNLKDLVPVLEAVARRKEPLVLIASEIEGEALATLATNRLRGTLMCCPVNFRMNDRAAVRQIREFTGATVFGTPLRHLDYADIRDLGRVSKVIVRPHETRLWRTNPDGTTSTNIEPHEPGLAAVADD